MQSQKDEAETKPSPVVSSCRKNKRDDATFFENMKDHIDEFIHSPMDEHVTCFKNTMNKMFGMSKIVSERNSEAQQVDSVLPLQTIVPK